MREWHQIPGRGYSQAEHERQLELFDRRPYLSDEIAAEELPEWPAWGWWYLDHYAGRLCRFGSRVYLVNWLYYHNGNDSVMAQPWLTVQLGRLEKGGVIKWKSDPRVNMTGPCAQWSQPLAESHRRYLQIMRELPSILALEELEGAEQWLDGESSHYV